MYIQGSGVDKRLSSNGPLLLSRMIDRSSCSIRRCAKDRNEQRRFYYWLRHHSITKERIINTSTQELSLKVSGRHVLSIQDTTEINYQAHCKRTTGLGTVGNGKDKGLFLHPLLVIDAQTGQGLGFAAIHTWNRTKSKAANYQNLPIESKESYRWLETAQAGKANLETAECVTFISDRESDIYELLDRIPDSHHHLLIRSRGDRRLYGEAKGLYEHLAQCAPAKHYTLNLPRTHKRRARVAEVALRYSTVRIRRPSNCTDQEAKPFVSLSVVQAKEFSKEDDAVNWCILTTHPVKTIEQAEQAIEWYKQRWQIEQLFRVLKSDGLNIEESQLETEGCLTKLVLVALNAALTVMQLVLAREGNTLHKTEMVFNEQERLCLKALQPTLEGKTEKLKNPYPPDNLAWAAWIIGRLGGWKGYKSEAKIGPITMARGLEDFHSIMKGFMLNKVIGTG